MFEPSTSTKRKRKRERVTAVEIERDGERETSVVSGDVEVTKLRNYCTELLTVSFPAKMSSTFADSCRDEASAAVFRNVSAARREEACSK